MSLFGTAFGQSIRKKADTPAAKTRKLYAAAEAKHLSCAQCPLDRAQLQHPKMTPTGSARPLLYVLGEAPGANEDEEGVQFVGQSGRLIRELIPPEFEHLIRWNNTIRCRPPGNRDPEPLELACCRRLQIEDIERTKPKAIAAFGNVPLSWMLGSDRSITNWRGRRMPVQVGSHRCWFYPITHPAAILRGQHDRKRGGAIKQCFEHDLERLFYDLEQGLPDAEVETNFRAGVECLEEYGEAGLEKIQLALSYWQNEEHAIDIETDRLRPYHIEARILSIAVGDYGDVLAFPYEHPGARWSRNEREKIHDMVGEYLLGKGRKWAHSAKFEMEWFHARYGPAVLYETEWGDTLGQAHILDERKGKSLDELTQLHFGFRLKDQSPIDVRRLADSPLSEVLPYNGMDVKYCFALSQVQTPLLQELELERVYLDRHAATASLIQMQAKGLVRNVKEAEAQAKALSATISKTDAKIMSDPDVVRYLKTGSPFKPTSNPNLVAFFRDFLRITAVKHERGGGVWHKHGGANENVSYSVDEGALSKIHHPVARLVLERRTADKNLGTYITPMLDGGKNVHGDGLLHPAYSQYVTVSGRLNSEDPNAQNYPRRKHREVRRVIGCPPGHRFVAFDYGQLEWRVGAMLSADVNMGNEIRAKGDIHGRWTDEIGGAFVAKLVKENRKKIRDSIKQFWTFALLYGNVLDAVARDLSSEFSVDISPHKLERFYDAFWGQYPNLLAYQGQLMTTYTELGYVETGTGQRRHEPMARNEIINHPFQGTAGHLVIDAGRRLAERAYREDRPQLVPILNVHDDLSFYLPKGTLEADIEDIAREMVAPRYSFQTVPLSVELSVGANWCDKDEVATFYTGEV